MMMATETKALLAVLLLACACTIYGENGAAERDLCTQGMEAAVAFIEYRGCDESDPHEIIGGFRQRLAETFTVDTLRQVLTSYCSTVLPDMRRCFEKNIQKCSADQRQFLRTLGRSSGLVCQPNSNSINPQISYMLSRLTDDDLVTGPSCLSFNDKKMEMDAVCYNRSMMALGLPSGDLRLLYDLTMDEFVSRARAFGNTMVECPVTFIRDDPNRCPQWRGVALKSLELIFWPVLGSRMTFTNQDLDRLFEWDSPSKRYDTGIVDDLFGLNNRE